MGRPRDTAQVRANKAAMLRQQIGPHLDKLWVSEGRPTLASVSESAGYRQAALAKKLDRLGMRWWEEVELSRTRVFGGFLSVSVSGACEPDRRELAS